MNSKEEKIFIKSVKLEFKQRFNKELLIDEQSMNRIYKIKEAQNAKLKKQLDDLMKEKNLSLFEITKNEQK